MNNNRKLVYVVTDNNVKAVSVESRITSQDLLTELINKYGDKLVSYHYDMRDAFETYYLNQKLFFDKDIDVLKNTNQTCVAHLEACLRKESYRG